jgi:hypothetical protein
LLLTNAVQAPSLKVYTRRWQTWCTFVRRLVPGIRDPDPFMRALPSNESVRWLCAFVFWLFVEQKYAASTTIQHISAVHHFFRARIADQTPFRSPSLTAARSGIHLAQRLRDNIEEAINHKRVPVSFDIVDHIMGPVPLHLITNKFEHMLRAATFVAFVLMLRIGEYTYQHTGNDHALRARNVTFKLRRGTQDIEVPADQLQFYLTPAQVSAATLLDTKLTLLTRKGDRAKVGSIMAFLTDDLEKEPTRNLVLILAHWALAANFTDKNDVFFSIPKSASNQNNSSNSLQPRMTLNGEHMCARLQSAARELGIPEDIIVDIKPHSLRIGGASTYKNGGVADSEIMSLGGWRSLPCALGYQWTGTGYHRKLASKMTISTFKAAYTMHDTVMHLPSRRTVPVTLGTKRH